MKRLFLFCFLMLLFRPESGQIAAASVERPPVAPRQMIDPAATNAGRTVFLNRCAKCHALPQVGRYSPAQWERIIPKMAKRSGLKPEQKQALLAYLLSSKTNTR